MEKQPWNEIVREYEENLHVLEFARAEYGNAVQEIMDSLGAFVNGPSPDGDAVFLHRQEEGDEAWKNRFCTDVRVDGITWCKITARAAMPWSKVEESAGKLHIAVETVNEHQNPCLDKEMIEKVTSNLDDWCTASPTDISGYEDTQGWIYLDAVDLLQGDMFKAIHEAYGKALRLTGELASHLRDELQPFPKAIKALQKCLPANNVDSALHRFAAYSPSKGIEEWAGMRYIQINIKPDVWVGYHKEKKTMMYGHGKEGEDFVGLGEDFADKMNCSYEEYGGYPAGTLMQYDDLQNSSAEDIYGKIVGCFESFAETVGEFS